MCYKKYGYTFVVAAAVLWGVGGAVAKIILCEQAVSPLLLVKIRLMLSSVILLIVMLIYDHRMLYISCRDIPYFAILGIGMTLVQYYYYLTIDLTSVATAVFLQYLAPVFIVFFEAIWHKEPINKVNGGAVFLAVIGGFFIMISSGGEKGINISGILSGLLSAAFLAFNTVYGKRAILKYNSATTLFYIFGFGALILWILFPYPSELIVINPTQWLVLIFIVFFATTLPYFFYYIGIGMMSPTNVSMIASLEPVVAAVAAYLLLGETFGLFKISGGFMVISAVILIQKGYNKLRLFSGKHFLKKHLRTNESSQKS